ncbi:MAG TPA: MerR family transcriptional regulator [Paracoccaceae bacterium]|nr:MerR family transcriptional regulator [Paracoccaceae bacterium]
MPVFYTEEEVVAASGRLTLARLRAYVEWDCVAPARAEGGYLYSEADLARLELIAELEEAFGLEAEALGMVLSLVDQIHGLRAELRRLAEAVAAEPDDVRARIRLRLGREG